MSDKDVFPEYISKYIFTPIFKVQRLNQKENHMTFSQVMHANGPMGGERVCVSLTITEV